MNTDTHPKIHVARSSGSAHQPQDEPLADIEVTSPWAALVAALLIIGSVTSLIYLVFSLIGG